RIFQPVEYADRPEVVVLKHDLVVLVIDRHETVCRIRIAYRAHRWPADVRYLSGTLRSRVCGRTSDDEAARYRACASRPAKETFGRDGGCGTRYIVGCAQLVFRKPLDGYQ